MDVHAQTETLAHRIARLGSSGFIKTGLQDAKSSTHNSPSDQSEVVDESPRKGDT